jgi:hypothetical protein
MSRSVETSGNNKKWKEFTNLKPGTYMTYKGRQYS